MPLPQFIKNDKVVKWGNLSQMSKIGDLYILGGQCGVTVDGNTAEGIEKQTKVTFDNIRVLLEGEGMTLRNIASLNVLLDPSLSQEEEDRFNEIYREIFPDVETRPCRCCYRAKLQGILIEVVNIIASK